MSVPPPKEVRPPLPQGPFLVIGLARSGQAVARLLADRGRDVTAVDLGHPEGAGHIRGAAARGGAAVERGIGVVGELELAWRAIPNRFVAVTGTNGKTTTVELLGHVYRSAGEPVAVAGHVGHPPP